MAVRPGSIQEDVQVFEYFLDALPGYTPIVLLAGDLGPGVDQGARVLALDGQDDLAFVRPQAGGERRLDDDAKAVFSLDGPL